MRSSRNSKDHIKWLQQRLSGGNISAKEQRRIVRQLYRANQHIESWTLQAKKPKIAKQTTLDSDKPSNSHKPSDSHKQRKPPPTAVRDPFVALSEVRSSLEPAKKSTHTLIESTGYVSLIVGVSFSALFAYHPYFQDHRIDATLVIMFAGLAAVGLVLVFAYVPFLRSRGRE